MDSLGVKQQDVRAVRVSIGEHSFTMHLEDGRALSVPFAWSPRLANATPAQRKDFRMIGSGEGINWPRVDEHLSVAGLLAGNPVRA